MDKSGIIFIKLSSSGKGPSVHPSDLVVPLQIAYPASLLKENGYDTEVIDTRVEPLSDDGLLQTVIQKNAKIIFFDCISSQAEILKRTARLIKNRFAQGLFIFAMGQHATVLPEDLLGRDGLIDACIIGEPEYTVMDLVKTGDFSRIEGIAYFDKALNKVRINPKREYIRQLDSLPFLDYAMFKRDRYKKYSAQICRFYAEKWGFMLSSRGCPYKCSFCSPVLRHSYGEEFRCLSAKRTVDEMEYLKNTFGINAISFEDENFSFDRQRVLDICNQIIKRRLNIKWVAQIHFNHIDEGMVYRMKEAGCDALRIGVESGSQRILQILKKGLDLREIEKKCAFIKKANISLTLFFMINNPGETFSEMVQTLKIAKDLNPIMLHLYFCTPYPGSQLYDDLPVKIKDFSSLCHYDRIGYNLCEVDTDKVKEFQKSFYRKFFLSPRYFMNYLKNRARYNLFKRDEWVLLARALRYVFSQARV